MLSSCVKHEILDTSSPTINKQVSYQVQNKEIFWEKDIFDAAKLATKDVKPLLLYFDNPLCSPCIAMDAVFKNDDVKSIVNRWFVSVKVDSRSKFAIDSGITNVPAIVLVVPSQDGGKIIGVSVGFIEPEQLVDFLEVRLKTTYKTID
jgi:thioredoxin-related protein